jgi:glycosyltransferase involved in cell wall biosynthesis
MMVATFGLCVVVVRGWSRLRQLRDVDPAIAPTPPLVSVIVAARDEALAIERALRSILALDYPALEVVVVNDRSTDGTGEILEALEAAFPNLQVQHVRELPRGWLGKNHALHRGAAAASGSYLVFTDADVVFEPSAIRRAVSVCEADRLDHLTLVPEIHARTNFLALSLMGGFVSIFAMRRPWRARETGRHGLGVGAFNMVRADAYRAAGGHERLAMEVLDDIELGVLMSRSGGRQDLLLAFGMLYLEMYPGMWELFRGIQKNVFTFLDYSALKLLAATIVVFSFSVWPWIGPFIAEGVGRWAAVASAAAHVVMYVYLAPRFAYSRWCAAYVPLTGFLTLALMWQIAMRTWIRGGVEWRGTFYPLEELKAGREKLRA